MNMDILMKNIANEIRNAVKKEYETEISEADILPLIQLGGIEGVDIECRIAFRMAKQLKSNPHQIAEKLLPHIKSELYDASSNGGYINLRLTNAFYESVLTDGELASKSKEKLKIIVEYPSVNPNKPLHIGHLRNAILGDCLSTLYEFCEHDVVRMNYIDDLGLQVAQSLWDYAKLEGRNGKKFDHWLGKRYVEISKLMEDEKVREQVEEIMRKLEKGDAELIKINREMCELCVKAQHDTLQKIGVFHDVLVWESDIVNAGILDKSMDVLRKHNVLKVKKEGKHAGCEVVELSNHPMFKNLKDADKVFIRSNGVATYTAKDTAFAMWKFGIVKDEMKFSKEYLQSNGKWLYTSAENGSENIVFNCASKVVNIIGVEQEYPQKIIKIVLEVAKFKNESENYVHISYAHARLPRGKFSGRKGTWIGYTSDELIDESMRRAYNKISDRFSQYDEKTKVSISKSVGIGAIRYAFTKISPEKELVFDWDKALSFEGDSGPYIQYSRTRAIHILEKEGMDDEWNGQLTLKTEIEKALVRQISMLSIVIENAVENNTVHKINDYATELASIFNKFYGECRVIGEEKNVRETRKRLIVKYLKTMDTCMKILGIPPVSNM